MPGWPGLLIKNKHPPYLCCIASITQASFAHIYKKTFKNTVRTGKFPHRPGIFGMLPFIDNFNS